MLRAEAESGLQFAGFAIFQCPLKPESEPALRMLRDSSHQVRRVPLQRWRPSPLRARLFDAMCDMFGVQNDGSDWNA